MKYNVRKNAEVLAANIRMDVCEMQSLKEEELIDFESVVEQCVTWLNLYGVTTPIKQHTAGVDIWVRNNQLEEILQSLPDQENPRRVLHAMCDQMEKNREFYGVISYKPGNDNT